MAVFTRVVPPAAHVLRSSAEPLQTNSGVLMATRVPVGDIRNLALVGHGAAGKTTLADAMLFKAGAVTRRGSVDDGTSVSDYDDEEHKRHFSIDSTVVHCDHDGKYLQLLD